MQTRTETKTKNLTRKYDKISKTKEKKTRPCSRHSRFTPVAFQAEKKILTVTS